MDRNNKIISGVLMTGVLAGSLTLAIGLYLFLSTNRIRNYRALLYSQFPHSPGSLINSLAHAHDAGIMMLGLLLIILTPITRVATSVLLFRQERDRPMAIVTAIVLCILLSSFIIGVLFK